ncbi:MAG TPA: lipopolysaccharide biosynthesis protein [Candidatus Marinimicrobia bacterium]|nr:lipopolysaccharide biosynthesis protein [Candidatus Neomarinimicrobiota bacterium]
MPWVQQTFESPASYPYPMIPKRILLKETFLYAVSKTVPGFAGLASVILFMRIIGAEQYGQYSFLLSQWYLIVAIGFGWLNQAQLRYYSKDNTFDDYKAGQIRAFAYSGLISVIVFSVLSIFQPRSIQLWGISIISIISIGGFNYIKTFFQAKLEPKKVIWLTLGQSILALSIPLGLYFLFQKNSFSILMGVGISFLLMTIIFGLKKKVMKHFITDVSKPTKTGKIRVKKWFFYGGPLSIWFAAGLAFPFLDRFFINLYLPGETLGVYAGIQELLTRIFSITIFPLTLALHPRIMNLWNDSKIREAIQTIRWGIGVMLGLAIVLCIVIWLFDTIIFNILTMAIPQINSQYKSLLLPLLSAGFLWQFSFLTHKMIELKEKTHIMVVFLLISLFINMVGNSMYIPHFGVQATANTAFVSALVYCILTGIYSMIVMTKSKN